MGLNAEALRRGGKQEAWEGVKKIFHSAKADHPTCPGLPWITKFPVAI